VEQEAWEMPGTSRA